MFYPNAQNIGGLLITAGEIRMQTREIGKSIEPLFCPSNVPFLDDDEDVLSGQLRLARETLDFSTEAAIIHHYSSLDLLKQRIFVIGRARSRLALEYGKLIAEIVKADLEDKQGALAAIEDVRSKWRQEGKRARSVTRRVEYRMHSSLSGLSDKINKIQGFHSSDPEVALALAEVYRLSGNLQSEYDALTIAIGHNYSKVKARRLRAQNLLARDKKDEAAEDLFAVLNSDETGAVDVSAAMRLLRQIDERWIERCEDLSFVSRLEWFDQVEITQLLRTSEEGARLSISILQNAMKDKDASGNVRYELVLTLIATGDFNEALQLSFSDREDALRSREIGEVFNYAMAEWGARGVPPLDLFEHVARLDDATSRGDANYYQCLAVVTGVLGQRTRAHKLLDRARATLGPGQVFSCWRYLMVTRDGMLTDLKAIEASVQSGKFQPRFLAAEGKGLSVNHLQ